MFHSSFIPWKKLLRQFRIISNLFPKRLSEIIKVIKSPPTQLIRYLTRDRCTHILNRTAPLAQPLPDSGPPASVRH